MIRPMPDCATVSIALLMILMPPTRGDEPRAAKVGDAPTFPRGEAAALGIDAGDLERLRKRAKEADSERARRREGRPARGRLGFFQEGRAQATLAAMKSHLALNA